MRKGSLFRTVSFTPPDEVALAVAAYERHRRVYDERSAAAVRALHEAPHVRTRPLDAADFNYWRHPY